MMIYLKLVLMAVFWGGAFVAGRSVSQALDSWSASFLRFAMASLILGGMVLFRNPGLIRKLRFRDIAGTALLGLTGIAMYNVFFFSGLRLISAGRASAIITNNPIVVLLLSALVFREKIKPAALLGILLSVTGACMVIFRGQIQLLLQGSVGRGELFILGCVFSWAVYSIMGKTLLKNMPPLHATFLATLFGTLLLAVPALRSGVLQQIPNLGFTVWMQLLYLAFCATVLGFVWFYDGVRAIGPTRASQFVNLVPVNAMILSLIFLHEPVTWSLAAGTALVITGVVIMQRVSQKI